MPGPILVNCYSTLRRMPEPDFPHRRVASRDLGDPELAKHLDDLAHYIASRGNGEMTMIRYHTIQHVLRVKNQITLEVEESHREVFARWAERANSVQFLADGSVRDPQGAVLVGRNGGSDPVARLPYPADALARKARTVEGLTHRGIKSNASMPPVPGEEEAALRPAREVAGRAHALILVAVQAENLAHQGETLLPRLRQRFPRGFTFLTPRERAFLDSDAPKRQSIFDMGWCYEALNLLLWALNLRDVLPPPNVTADAGMLARTMIRLNEEPGAETEHRLRPTTDILDALDETYRLHWAVRDAELAGGTVAAIDPDLIQERHKALNWLTGFHNPICTAWDEIDTPT